MQVVVTRQHCILLKILILNYCKQCGVVQDAVKELGSLLEAKSLAVEQLTSKVELLRDTLDCTYTGIVFIIPSNPTHKIITKTFLKKKRHLLHFMYSML